MTQIANDGLKVFKIVKSCTQQKQLEVAKNCYEQFQIKWLNKISLEDESSIRVLNSFVDLIATQYKKVESKLTK